MSQIPGSQEAFSWVGLPLTSSVHCLEFPVISKLRTSQGLQVSKFVKKRLVPLCAAHFREDLLCDPAEEMDKLCCYDERGVNLAGHTTG